MTSFPILDRVQSRNKYQLINLLKNFG